MFLTYPVNCSRAMEILALTYCLSTEAQRPTYLERIVSIVEHEPGAKHPISDWYAVSLALVVRVLADADMVPLARGLCRSVAVWVGDNYENSGSGLASMDVDEVQEARQLLGFAFEGLKVRRQETSLISTTILDAACFIGESGLHGDVLHDLKTCDIIPIYYQPQDSAGQFLVEGEDVVAFPNIEFAEPMPVFTELKHGEHLDGEPRSFKLESLIGGIGYAVLSLLLRDRYFPTTWAQGISQSPIESVRARLEAG